MIEYINTIIESVKQSVPEIKKAIALAKIDDENRVLVRDQTSNEYIFAGINDLDNGWMYVRTRDDGRINFSDPSTNKKFAAMQSFFRVRYELRIVAMLKNVDPWCLEESIRFGVMNAPLASTASFANISIIPVESIVDPISVATAESPSKKPKPFSKNMTMVAFDFDLVGDRDMALDAYCLHPCSGSSC
jgi:hypothetical protein